MVNGCQVCNIGLEYLPALDFHHQFSNKKIVWSNMKSKNINKIIEALEKEKVSLRCSNCHSLELNYSQLFLYFKDFILQDRLFNNYSPIELNKKIDDLIDNSDYSGFTPNTRIKRDLKRNMKKRYVIEKVFNGECIGCKAVGINQLPALDFHHKNPLIKKSTWGNHFRDFKIPVILNIILKEEIICLCKNCHEMIKTPYFNNISNKLFDQQYIKRINDIYEKINFNINSFKINITDFSDPIDNIDNNSDYYQNRYFGKNL